MNQLLINSFILQKTLFKSLCNLPLFGGTGKIKGKENTLRAKERNSCDRLNYQQTKFCFLFYVFYFIHKFHTSFFLPKVTQI